MINLLFAFGACWVATTVMWYCGVFRGSFVELTVVLFGMHFGLPYVPGYADASISPMAGLLVAGLGFFTAAGIAALKDKLAQNRCCRQSD